MQNETDGTKSNLNLTYDNPVAAVFLRTLAWEIFVAGKKLSVGGVVTNEVQIARTDLGLQKSKKGAPHDFVQRLRDGPEPLLSQGGTPPRPMEKEWEKEWRLLHLPSHRHIRSLSFDPVIRSETTSLHTEYSLLLRSPSLPRLTVTVSKNPPKQSEFAGRRGVYFLREPSSLYIGKTTEFGTRFRTHKDQSKRTILWWVLVTPEGVEQTFSQDSLAAAESLLISLWNEVATLSNKDRGGDQEPAFAFLQHGVLLVEAASAAFIWLLRERASLGLPCWEIPFKSWKGQGWPDCYSKSPFTEETTAD